MLLPLSGSVASHRSPKRSAFLHAAGVATLARSRIRKTAVFNGFGAAFSSAGVSLSDTTSSSCLEDKQTSKIKKRRRTRIPVLYNADNSWICINKPAGISVHHSNQPQNRFQSNKAVILTELQDQLNRKDIFPVHRLDHRTSGALLVALDEGATATRMHAALKESQKIYLALLHGDWDQNGHPDVVTVDQPIISNGNRKPALTVFRKLCVWNNKNDGEEDSSSKTHDRCTLVTVEPQTGRTHQIRRHAAWHLKMPVLGDRPYGNTKVNRYWRVYHDLNRLALHCLAIADLQSKSMPLDDDDDGTNDSNNKNIQGKDRLTIIAPLPDDFRVPLQSLHSLWEEATMKEPRLLTDWIDYEDSTKLK